MSDKTNILSSLWSAWALATLKEKRRVFFAAGCLFIAGLLDLASTLGAAPLIQLLITPDHFHNGRLGMLLADMLGPLAMDRLVLLLGASAITLFAFAQIANFGAFFVLSRVVAAAQTRMGHDVIDRCLNAPYPWFLQRDFSKLSRIIYDDVTRWSQQFLGQLVGLIAAFATFCVAVGALLITVSWLGVGLLILISLLSLGFMRSLRPLVVRFGQRERFYGDELFSLASQLMASIKDVKLSSQERAFTRLMDLAFSRCSLVRVKQNMAYQAPPIFLTTAGQVFLLGFALLLWGTGAKPDQIFSQMTIMLLITARVVPILSRMSSQLSGLWGVSSYIEGLTGIIHSMESKKIANSTLAIPIWSYLSTTNLCFRYDTGQSYALKDVSVRFERFKVHGIVGVSGGGKSTLVDMLFGLLEPSSGDVRIDGRPLSAFNIKDWQRRIGYVPQSPFIMNDTLLANVAFGVPAERVDVDRAVLCLEMANLGDLLGTLPDGVFTPLGDRGARFSGGQRQRVALARALYRAPEFLVLDEATSALDAISEKAVYQAILSLRGRVTILIITHSVNLLRATDSVVVFGPNSYVEQDSFRELEVRSEAFRKLISDHVVSESKSTA